MLRSYHNLTIKKLDDYNSDGDCEVRGRITFSGKQYHWRKHPGNQLLTNFGGKNGEEDVLGGTANPAPPLSAAQAAREQREREKPVLRQRQPMVVLLNHDFALPASAMITLGKPKGQKGPYGTDTSSCGDTPSTAAAVRQIFRSYHELAGRETHDWYAYFGCSRSGTIRYHGRIFRFHYETGNTLSTDYPDGFPHGLGGRYTDDLGLGG